MINSKQVIDVVLAACPGATLKVERKVFGYFHRCDPGGVDHRRLAELDRILKQYVPTEVLDATFSGAVTASKQQNACSMREMERSVYTLPDGTQICTPWVEVVWEAV